MLTSLISLLLPEGGAASAQGAQAAAADAGNAADSMAAAGGSGWSTIIMIVAMIAIFYFLLIRPQQKQQKKIREMRNSMRVGDSVVTSGGIYGKITEINDTTNTMIISIADGVRIKVDKGSVFASPEDAAAAQQQK